jgi:hypothetical protein
MKLEYLKLEVSVVDNIKIDAEETVLQGQDSAGVSGGIVKSRRTTNREHTFVVIKIK